LRVLFDTNVILDVLLDREPHVEASARILYRVENGELSGWLCATTVTTVFYFVAKAAGRDTALAEIRKLFSLFEIATVNRPVLEGALVADFSDYEDAVLHQAARQVDAKAIVTRNSRHFKNAALPVYTPDELSEILALQTRKT
jgi:predicted nucleic acid-binding protein